MSGHTCPKRSVGANVFAFTAFLHAKTQKGIFLILGRWAPRVFECTCLVKCTATDGLEHDLEPHGLQGIFLAEAEQIIRSVEQSVHRERHLDGLSEVGERLQ